MGKQRIKLKSVAGAVLLLTVGHAWALSLGAVQGGVIIGRPLDILVQSNIDASEAASGLCLEAEVLFGDTRLPASSVTATIHRVATDGTGALRVRTKEAVTEPIVSLVLKAGCNQTFRRSYALLADVEPTPVPVAPVATLQAPALAAARPALSPAAAQPAQSVPPSRPSSQVAPPANGTARTEAPAEPETPIRLAAPAPRPANVTWMKSKVRPVAVEAGTAQKDEGTVATAKAAEPVVPSGPRLKLDPIDLTPADKASPPTAAAAPDSPAPAPAVPSEATTAPPLAADGAGVAENPAPAVAREIEALREEQARMRLAMEAMNAQLAQAQASQYQNPVVYGLGAAVLAMLAGIWALARRRHRPSPEQQPTQAPSWWETAIPTPAPDTPPNPTETVQPAWSDSKDVTGLEVSEAGESVFKEVPIATLDVGALLDLWQRIDFLESLGQHAEAMDALKSFVTDHPRASEAPYLRWMAIARQHGSDADRALAQAFYENHYQRLSQGPATVLWLEDDRAFLTELIKWWPSADAKALLEGVAGSQPGDLQSPLKIRTAQSYDDILTLLGLLELREPDTADEGFPSLSALKAAAQPPHQPPAAPAPSSVVPDLDIDLAALGDEKPAPAADASAGSPSPSTNAIDFEFLDWELPKPPTAGAAAAGEDKPKV